MTEYQYAILKNWIENKISIMMTIHAYPNDIPRVYTLSKEMERIDEEAKEALVTDQTE